MTFKKLREWVREEHEMDVELDEIDGHTHEYRPHSGHYETIDDERIFVWEWDLCRRCHKKRERPKTHKHKTKTVTIEAGVPVLQKELTSEPFVLADAETGEIVDATPSDDTTTLSIDLTTEQ